MTRRAPTLNTGSREGCGYREPAETVELMAPANTTRNWPTPRVATIDTSRGAERRRRTTPASAAAPTAPEAARAAGNMTQ